jgi:hypothetical protein
MKIITTTIVLFFGIMAFGQRFGINDTEYFTVSTSVDPSASFKEKGLDIVAEIEYVGFIYTKVGIESFSVLYKGYFDTHAAIGINFTSGYFDKYRYYAGMRFSCVFRDDAFAVNPGIEAGIDVFFNESFFIGIRGTVDKRFDQGIFHWPEELKPSGFVRIGYRWNWL